MTWPLNRRIRPAAPAFDAAPVEPPAAVRAPIYIDRELAIELFDDLAAWAARQGLPQVVDQVLEQRNKIRPARTVVPVIPGRTS